MAQLAHNEKELIWCFERLLPLVGFWIVLCLFYFREECFRNWLESENPSVLVARQLISDCIIYIKLVPFFNPGGVALPRLSAVLVKGWWSRLWAALVFTEPYQHSQALHAVIHLQASGGEHDAEWLFQSTILKAAQALLQLKDKIAPLYISLIFFFFFLTQAAHLSFYSLECFANGVFMQVMAADDFPFGSGCFTRLLFCAVALSMINLSAVSPG